MTLTLLLAGSTADAYGVQNAEVRAPGASGASMPAGLQANAVSAA